MHDPAKFHRVESGRRVAPLQNPSHSIPDKLHLIFRIPNSRPSYLFPASSFLLDYPNQFIV
jgi:hypothetical protein